MAVNDTKIRELMNTKAMITTLSVISLVIFMLNIDVTGAYLILKPVALDLPMPLNQTSWIVTLYLAAFAAMIVIGGRLGDLWGHRNILALGLVLFAIASSLAGIAATPLFLLIARALQGVAAALIWPNTTTIVFNNLPEKHKGFGIGLTSSVIGVGLASGPILSGLFATYLSWRWLFFINVPICLFALVTLLNKVPNQITNKGIGLDIIGTVLLAGALGLLTLGLNQLPIKNQQFDAFVMVFASLGLFVAFVYVERRVRFPIIPKVIIKNSYFLYGCLLRCLTIMPFYITLFIMSFFLQQDLKLSAFSSGIVFLPMMLAITLFSPVAGKLVDYWGSCFVLQLGILFYIIGFGLLVALIHYVPVFIISFLLFFVGTAFALTSPAILTFSMHTASNETKGAASGLFFMVSVSSGLLGVTLSSVIIHVFPPQQGFSFYVPLLTIFLVSIGVSLLAIFFSSIRRFA